MRRPHVDLPLCSFSAVLAVLLSSAAMAQLPVSDLTTLTPAGGKQGTTVSVVAGGGNLDDGAKLLFSHPGITAKVKQAATPEFRKSPQTTYNQFDVTIAKDVPPGRYEARVVGRFGASNPRTFVVGRFDEIQDDNANKTFDAARAIAINSVTNGRVDAATRDYFKLALKANQRVLIDCAAVRVDSRLDAMLVLYDANRKELARTRRDSQGDALLDFTPGVDGDYYVEVYDFLYRGGGEYFYRLAIHDQPHVDFVLPLAGFPGSDVPYTVYGRNLPGGVDSGFTIDGQPLQKAIVNLKTPNSSDSPAGGAFVATEGAVVDGFSVRPLGANEVRLGFTSEPRLILEAEPNNTKDSPQKVEAPCEFHGQFYPRRDEDWIEFQANKGQVFRIDVISQRLGVVSDPYLAAYRVVKNDKGEESLADVGQADDPGNRNAKIGAEFDTTTDDPAFRFVAPETATYRLRIRDQFGVSRDDPRAVYRLAIRTEKPDFRLYAIPQQLKVANANQVLNYAPNVRRGGSTLLRVDAARLDGFAGEIALRVEGLPEGVTCRETVMPAAGTTAWLILEAAENAAIGATPIRVIGKAAIGEIETNRTARPVSIVWGTGNKTTARAEDRATQDLVMSVVPDLHQVQAVLGDDKRVVASKGAKVTIPFKITRRGFEGDIKFVAQNLPAEVKPADVTVKKDGNDTKLEWTLGNAKAKPGVYHFYLRGDIKIKHVQNPDAIVRAETAQKEVTESIAAVDADVKQKTAARDAANKAAAEAANALKQAQQAAATASSPDAKKMAEKTLADAKTASDAKAKAKADAETALKASQDALNRANAAKKAVDKLVADTKKANAAKDVNILVASSPVTFEVVATPITFKPAAMVTVKQGEKATLNIGFERLYGFGEAMDVSATVPGAAKGLTVAKVNVAKDKSDGGMEVSAAADAAPGDHTITLKAVAKFNNVPVEATQTVVVRVVAK